MALCFGKIVDEDKQKERWIMRCDACGKLYYGVSKKSEGLLCPSPRDFATIMDYQRKVSASNPSHEPEDQDQPLPRKIG